MTATYTDNGDGTATVTFAFTGDVPKPQNIIEKAAYKLWYDSQLGLGEVTPWEEMTAQDKLDLVDNFVRTSIRNFTRRQVLDEYNQTAQTDFDADWDANYELGLGA